MAYSLSKIHITKTDVQEIVSHFFGANRRLHSVEELKDGFFNAAVLFELDNGVKCVMKAAPTEDVTVLRYEHDIMRAEVESMRLVHERTSVPVPEILIYDDSRQFLPSSFFVMKFLPGMPFNKLRPSLDAEGQARVEVQMGQMTRAISEITGDAFGYWAQPEPPTVSWKECFTHMVRGVMQDGIDAGVPMPLPYEEIFNLIAPHLPALDEVTVPRLVHWDLWDGNVFVDPQTLLVTGLIDFERVMWADPLMEAIFGYPSPDTNYVRGFGAPLYQNPKDVHRRILYNTYLFLIMIIECTYRRFETHDQENWARARLDETIHWLQESPPVS